MLNYTINHKKWFVTFLCIASFILATIGSINFYLLRKDEIETDAFFQSAMPFLKSQQSFLLPSSDLVVHGLAKTLIDSLESNPDIVAVGSSRVYNIRSRYLEKPLNYRCIFSFGITLKTVIGLLGYYKMVHSKLPSTIIVGIDPWMLDEDFKDPHPETIHPKLQVFIPFIFKTSLPTWLTKIKSVLHFNFNHIKDYYLKNLFSYQYLEFRIKQSLKCTGHPIPNKSSKANAKFATIWGDGSFTAPTSLNSNNQNWEKDCLELERNFSFKKISNASLLERLTQELQNDQVELILYLAPISPALYDHLSAKKSNIAPLAEAHIKSLAKQYNLKVLGSYDPHTLNLSNTDFFDHSHVRDWVVEMLISKVEI